MVSKLRPVISERDPHLHRRRTSGRRYATAGPSGGKAARTSLGAPMPASAWPGTPLENTELLRFRQNRVECVAQEPGGITGSAKMSYGDWLDEGFVLGTDQKPVGA
jgi:hypothetical protein